MAQHNGTEDGSNMKLTHEQRVIIEVLERTGGALSLVAVIAIIVTFILLKRMRTVPNTFILFASIANIGACIAAIIGFDGLDRGKSSALCQTQAFLLEMFMQSDSWWSFAMAVNVYLVFFWHASPDTFRQYLWAYCVVCYGVPMIPALVMVSLRRDGGLIFGDATLWCWIDDSYNQLRIYSYYLPIWCCIFFSTLIYIAVGYHVFHQRNQLRNLSLSNPGKDSISDVRDSAEKNLTRPVAGYYGTVTTEVQITSDVCRPHHARNPHVTPPFTPARSAFAASATMISPSNAFTWADPDDDEDDDSSRSNTVVAGGSQHHYHHHHHHYHHHHHTTAKPFSAISNVVTSPTPSRAVVPASALPMSPLNRSRTTSTSTGLSGPRRALRRCRAKLRNTDPVKLAYLRTSFVFAISVIVTWTPSSINRIYNLVNQEGNSYPLNIASAAVLPLQGVWNAVIYFTTSWKLLRDELRGLGYKHGWEHPRWLWGGKRLAGGFGAGGGRRGSEGIAPDRHVRFGAGEPWQREEDSTEMELRCARMCTVRIQKGGQLDT